MTAQPPARPELRESLTAEVLGWRRPIVSFWYRDFRIFWFSQLGTSGGHWMDQVTRGWLVLELTNSPFMLGVAFALRSIPILIFSLVAGVMADRLPRKLQLISAQASNAIINVVLAALILTGNVELWHVLVSSFLSGVATSFQQPTRQAILPGLVPRAHLANAIGLSSAALSLTRSLGPTAAGFLIFFLGTGFAILMQAALYVFALVLTAAMHIVELPSGRELPSPVSSFMEGVRYIRGHSVVGIVLVVALVPVLLVTPYVSLLSVFARDILEIGAQGLGFLLLAAGLGAIVGAFWMATFAGSFSRKGWIILGGATVFSLSIALFAVSGSFVVALGLMALAGVAQTVYHAMAQTLLHTSITDEMRGRVMSVFFLERGLVPFGTFLAGTLATLISVSFAVATMSGLAALILVIAAVKAPRVRRL